MYVFDLMESPAESGLTHKRPIWRGEDFGDDEFHVSADGYLVGVAGCGVDGGMGMRIETGYVVNNLRFAGPNGGDLWLFGMGRICRVRWNTTGMMEK